MCGICGVWDAAGADEATVRSMNAALVHRGPDDEGYYFNGPVGFGHRRLSTIDLDHGRQPISNEDGTIWIVFNGEIYNFRELRRKLEAVGHRFRTATDTEVIVHLYEERGADCVLDLRGMFAFAIWDETRQKLFMARDHVGQKPLFFYHSTGLFAFASEIKALLRLDRVRVAMDPAAMNHLISLRYTPETRTLFENIQKLPAGHRATFQAGQLRAERYWSPDYTRKLDGGEEEVAGELRTLLLETVESHLIADVPVGAFLSGGIDSSTVAAMMAVTSGKTVQTFSIGVREADFNELPYARLVASKYKTEHYEHVADDQLIGLLPKLIWHMDEIADPFGFGVFLVAQLAKRHVKVVSGGDGGDELFAGYDRYAGNKLVDYYCLIPGAFRRRLLPSLMRLIPDSYSYNSTTQKIRWLNAMSLVSGGERYAQSMCYLRFSHEIKERLFSDALQRELGDEFDSVCHVVEQFEGANARDALDRMLYTDMMTRMPECLLRLVDHMTMAHGVEDRSPLLDRRLVEFAASIPVELKLRGRQLKYIFKKVAGEFLPPDLLARSKQGFSFPLAYWMKGPLGHLLEYVFARSRLAAEGYFRRETMLALLEQHRRGEVDHNYRLWILLNLELWWRIYINGLPLASVHEFVDEPLKRRAA